MYFDISRRKKFAQELRQRFASFSGDRLCAERCDGISREGARREFRDR
jgi:hypothetical protein